MPVRFRCAYCNQLLGISRRKAGTIVRCPTCAGQVVVPSTEPMPVAERPEAAGQNPALFERSDFDELFHLPGAEDAPRAAPAPVGAAHPNDLDSAFDVQPFQMIPPSSASSLPARKDGSIVLSPQKATVLTVVAMIALGLAFGAGFLVGQALK